MTEQNSCIGFDPNSIISDLITNTCEKFLRHLKDSAVDKGKKITVDFEMAFSKYLKRAYEKHTKIKTLLYRREPRDLYDFFVCNDLKVNDAIVNCTSISSILNRSNFSIILGSGGTGKSVLLRHFFADAIKTQVAIPLFVELRNLNKGQNLEEFIYESLSNLGFELEYEYFLYALNNGHFVILLDGYDEIAEDNKHNFYVSLDRLCDKYPENYYIVSSRDDGGFVGWQRFTTYDTKPLSLDKAVELVTKLDYDTEIKEKFIGELKKELYIGNVSFASNPLLLTIMLLTYDNYAEIPKKRHVFYAKAFDTLYSAHDSTKGGYRRDLKSGLASEDFKSIFAEFCFRSYLKNKYEFTSDELYELLSQTKCINFMLKSEIIENFILDITTSVCLMNIEGRNYVFAHRSFQEYFAAVYISKLSDEKQALVCKSLINASNYKIRTDCVFDMLMDMNVLRFCKNVLIPFIEEMEKQIPGEKDDFQRYFLGIIDEIIFCDLNSIEDWPDNIIFIIAPIKGYEGTRNVALFTCKKEFNSEMIFFIANELYNEKEMRRPTLEKKIDVKYLQNSFKSSEVIRDNNLYNFLVNSQIYNMLSTFIGLLPRLKKEVNEQEINIDDILSDL